MVSERDAAIQAAYAIYDAEIAAIQARRRSAYSAWCETSQACAAAMSLALDVHERNLAGIYHDHPAGGDR
jgi:hypothetical protein